MKRSELLYDLAALLQNTEYIDVPISQYIEDEKLALQVLDFLESKGMLPPFCRTNEHEDFCEYYDGEQCNCGGVVASAWEPEDG